MGQQIAVTKRPDGPANLADRPAVTRFGLLLVGNFLSKSRPGSFSVCELLAERLSSAGWPVTTTSDRPGRLGRLTDMLSTVWRRRREYDVAQVDVYSGPSFVWAESVCWLLTRLGKPFILTLHGGNLPSFAKRCPGRVRRLLDSAHAVTNPSRYLQEALRSYREELLLLPNAIDIASYPFKLRGNPQPKLIWLRAFHRMYNPCMAVRVVAALLHEFPGIQMIMVGPDKGDGSLEEVQLEVKRLGLEGRISVAGPVPKNQVPVVLDSGDIFLNTTNVDNTPVSVIEALASGLCVVSTNVGGLPALLENEQDGLLVQPESSSAMATAVRRTLLEPGLAERLSRNARAKAEQLDWSKILPRWETLLAQAAVAEGQV